MKVFVGMILGFLLAIPLLSKDYKAELEFMNPEGYDALDLPFTDAVRVDNLLFLSGKIGNQPGTRNLVPGGVQGETRQIMQSISEAVQRYGSSMERVVKCTVFLEDIEEWQAMNEVYVTFFPGSKPARSALGVDGLALGAALEIECIAAL